MKKLLPILLLTFASAIFAQLERYSTPNVWETYRSAKDNFSVALPKMPTLERRADWCDSTETTLYYAYAEGAVYEVTVTSKSEDKTRQQLCGKKLKHFGEKTLERRLGSLRLTSRESRDEIGGRRAFKFENDDSMRWVISDLKEKDRWIELAVFFYPKTEPEVDKFFESIRFSATGGREIGGGADLMLGDLKWLEFVPKYKSNIAADLPTPTLSEKEKTLPPGDPPRPGFPYWIIAEPKARRTDPSSCVQGAVRLKITLLANGGVGTIVPVTRLPDGLTESAIAAARRIVFLPKRVNGVAVSVVVTREYPFTIY